MGGWWRASAQSTHFRGQSELFQQLPKVGGLGELSADSRQLVQNRTIQRHTRNQPLCATTAVPTDLNTENIIFHSEITENLFLWSFACTMSRSTFLVLPVSTPILGYTLSDSSWYQVLFINYSVPSKQDDESRKCDCMPLTGSLERLIHKTHRQFVKTLQPLSFITLVTEPMLTRHKSILWSNDKV